MVPDIADELRDAVEDILRRHGFEPLGDLALEADMIEGQYTFTITERAVRV